MSTTVAVIGLNGFLGKSIIEALLREPFVSKLKQPIRLLTRSDKKPVESSKVEYINTTETGYPKALEGVDAVINVSAFPNPAADEILDAVIKANVKLYLPSQFGTDLEASEPLFPKFLSGKTEHSQKARDAGLKVVDYVNGLFAAEVGGPFVTPLVQIDGTNATVHADENLLVNPTFFQDIGNSVASIVTFDDYNKLPNKVRIYSDKVVLGQLISKYEKDYNVKLNKTYKSGDEFLKYHVDRYAKNGFEFSHFFQDLGSILYAGEGKGLIFEEANERELLNPNESLFKWTKFEI